MPKRIKRLFSFLTENLRFKFLSVKRRVKKNVLFGLALRQKLVARQRRLGRLGSLTEIPFLFKKLLAFYREQVELLPNSDIEQAITSPIDPYQAWLAFNRWNERTEEHLRNRLRIYSAELPKLSVVVPTYNTPAFFLERAIESVVNQIYSNWELCIADDYSSSLEVREILNHWSEKDDRIKVVFRSENGNISRATNSAASIATGEFLVFLDHDDELTLDALGEIALYLAKYPETDFLYSDDDKIDGQNQRYAPQFKPDWSPELLLSYMYMGHICAVRRNIFERVGGLRVGFEGSQDYDFALRATEICQYVGHLPLILYHWRAAEGSTATSGKAKPDSFSAGQRALQEALDRRGVTGTVYHPDWAEKAGCGIFEYQFPDDGPSVSIIIPTKNQVALLRECVTSIAKTTYRNYKIIIIDNESDDPETLRYLASIPHTVLRINNDERGFNYAAINNQAARVADSDYLLFLNNDTEVISPQWLSQMVGFAQFSKVGAVGARLLYPDHRIQHAGVVHGLHHGLAGHAFKLLPSWNHGYLAYANVVRNYSAVSAACLLTPRSLFLEIGGFDEDNFVVAYNDVDYCYRLVDGGYRCVYCPTAELFHKEGATRGFRDNPNEVVALKRKYFNKVDAYYSPHLSLADEQFNIQPRKIATDLSAQIKVLVVTHNLNWEGAPYHQYDLVVALKKIGAIQPIVYSPQDGPLRKAYEAAGITVYVKNNPLEQIVGWEVHPDAINKLVAFIQQQSIDVVYANTIITYRAVVAARQAQIPSVWNIHESEDFQCHLPHLSQEALMKTLNCLRFPYRVVYVSDATKHKHSHLNIQHNFVVIHNGLNLEKLVAAQTPITRKDARQSLSIEEDEVVLLAVGTVCERKGQHDLVLALSKLSAQCQRMVKVFIVGDRPSPYSQQLRETVAALPNLLQKRISIVAETPNVATFYMAADIFVFSSRIESYPRVILEAMNFGLPIITTPVFGIVEQVKSGVNAEFYHPGETEALASLLERFIESGSLRVKYGANSKVVLESLTNFEEMVEAYLTVFREAYLSSVL